MLSVGKESPMKPGLGMKSPRGRVSSEKRGPKIKSLKKIPTLKPHMGE